MRSALITTLLICLRAHFSSEEIFSAVQNLQKLFHDENEIIKEMERLIESFIDIIEDLRKLVDNLTHNESLVCFIVFLGLKIF